MEKLVLIDGNSLINRAFYAMPVLTTKDGVPTNAVYGFLNMLFKIKEYSHVGARMNLGESLKFNDRNKKKTTRSCNPFL